MRSFTLVSALGAAQQTLKAEPPFVWDVVGQSAAYSARPTKAKTPLSAYARSVRTPDNCKFALDVVILQDATDSFSDNFASMKNTQLDLIYNGITSAHPNSTFGMVSFKDKPIWPLGDRDDYCSQYNAPLAADVQSLKKAYENIASYGGADAPENQLGALYNVLATNKINWTQGKEAAKLVVISTDAGPHFAGDSRSAMLPPFNPQSVSDDDMSVCTSNYYPSLDQAKGVIEYSGAYVASLVYDGDWANGWPSKSWIAFNSFIGQRPEFVAAQAPDSSDFWHKLAAIIKVIEDEECYQDTTTTVSPTTSTAVTTPPIITTMAPTTTAPPTTTTMTPTTSAPPTTTTMAPTTTAVQTTTQTPVTTTAVPTRPGSLTTAGTPQPVSSTISSTSKPSQAECNCDCTSNEPSHDHHCPCCPEVVIALRHRPSSLNLNLENKL